MLHGNFDVQRFVSMLVLIEVILTVFAAELSDRQNKISGDERNSSDVER